MKNITTFLTTLLVLGLAGTANAQVADPTVECISAKRLCDASKPQSAIEYRSFCAATDFLLYSRFGGKNRMKVENDGVYNKKIKGIKVKVLRSGSKEFRFRGTTRIHFRCFDGSDYSDIISLTIMAKPGARVSKLTHIGGRFCGITIWGKRTSRRCKGKACGKRKVKKAKRRTTPRKRRAPAPPPPVRRKTSRRTETPPAPVVRGSVGTSEETFISRNGGKVTLNSAVIDARE